jgi:hypothetical protein
VYQITCDEIESVMTANKQRAIKNTLARLGMHATPKQVVAELQRFGIEVSEEFVSRVKDQIRREESKALAERSKRPPKKQNRNRLQQRKIPQRRG